MKKQKIKIKPKNMLKKSQKSKATLLVSRNMKKKEKPKDFIKHNSVFVVPTESASGTFQFSDFGMSSYSISCDSV